MTASHARRAYCVLPLFGGKERRRWVRVYTCLHFGGGQPVDPWAWATVSFQRSHRGRHGASPLSRPPILGNLRVVCFSELRQMSYTISTWHHVTGGEHGLRYSSPCTRSVLRAECLYTRADNNNTFRHETNTCLLSSREKTELMRALSFLLVTSSSSRVACARFVRVADGYSHRRAGEGCALQWRQFASE